MTPSQPVDLAASLAVPVLGLYGGQDGSIPQDSVNSMRQRWQQGHSGSQIVVYPEAGHAFNADYRPSYNAAAARMAGSACWPGWTATAWRYAEPLSLPPAPACGAAPD
jgi:dienelactone hydrolase